MFLDNERDIMRYLQLHLSSNQVLLYNGNSFEKKVWHCISDLDALQDNSGHDALPPDFYSPRYSVMFDVMRTNDTEEKKTYNPKMSRERGMEKELRENGFIGEHNPDAIVICNSESSEVDSHSYAKYLKQLKRVVSIHLSSNGHPNKLKDIWEKEHPDIKYKGLLIFDETECYYEGVTFYAGNDLFGHLWRTDRPLVLHRPWEDKNMMQQFYDSDLDFIVWACPCKVHSYVTMKAMQHYPAVVIIDVRGNRDRYTEYDTEHLSV